MSCLEVLNLYYSNLKGLPSYVYANKGVKGRMFCFEKNIYYNDSLDVIILCKFIYLCHLYAKFTHCLHNF